VVAVALVAAAGGAVAQEIYQAVILDLTDLEVHVTVARARGDEELRCFVRAPGGRARLVGSRPVSDGLASGGTTILTISLPILGAGEREFAVALVRGETELHRTDWQPIFRTPARGTRP
jgi:hypothetical protein